MHGDADQRLTVLAESGAERPYSLGYAESRPCRSGWRRERHASPYGLTPYP
jgi:hypothetical protein